MKKERFLYTSLDNLPLSLSADDIAVILNISRTRVYQLLHEGIIPKMCFGQRMVIPRDRFLEWMKKELGE